MLWTIIILKYNFLFIPKYNYEIYITFNNKPNINANINNTRTGENLRHNDKIIK